MRPRIPAGSLAAMLFVVVVVGAAAVAGGSLGDVLEQPLAPFVAQHEGQSAWLAVRVILLASVLLVASMRPAPTAAAIGAFATAVVVGSLAFQGLLLVWVAVAATVLVSSPLAIPKGRARVPALAIGAGAAIIVLGAAIVLRRRARLPVDWAANVSEDPARATAQWRDHGNPWRARHAASAWARAEGAHPGAGHLALAELDDSLGARGSAIRILRFVATNGESEALRADARTRLQRIGAAP